MYIDMTADIMYCNGDKKNISILQDIYITEWEAYKNTHTSDLSSSSSNISRLLNIQSITSSLPPTHLLKPTQF